nr:glycosyltransferase [uncultured Desulfobacter sp.]
MENDEPIVSVCCITYNHENFIRDAIDGFLSQKTSFPTEIIIHDDCSTDSTVDIIHEYVAKHPGLIKPIFQKENQYSQGRKIFPIVFSAARGKYIAVCEGDDYWTDPDKLQRQVDFLEKNTKYVMVTENAIDDNLRIGKKKKFSELPERDINILELLGERSFATASVLFRNLGEQIMPGGNISGDTILWCHLSTLGKIKYLENISSVYRRHNQGVTSGDLIQWSKRMVDWNNTLRGNHPEIDSSIFIQRILNQFKFPMSSMIRNRQYKKALLTAEHLINYTGNQAKFREQVFQLIEELLLQKDNSWSLKIGRAITTPVNFVFQKSKNIIKLIATLFNQNK